MLACALAAMFPGRAPAQEQGGGSHATVTPPGERLAVTSTGVDMRSGQYAYSATDLTIGGEGEAGGLTLTRGIGASVPGHPNPFANLGHNWDILISEQHVDIDEGQYHLGNGPDYRMAVHFGGRSETFDSKVEDSGFQQVSNNWRATLTFSGDRDSAGVIYTFTATDGTVAQFRPLGNLGGDCGTIRRCAHVSSVAHPDGTRLDFDYDAGTPTRLRAVVSNRGYALLLQYGSGGDANHITSACVLNLAVQPRPADNACPTNAQAATSYGYTAFESRRRLASATDANGRISRFTYERVGGTLRMGFLSPGNDSAWMTNSLTEWTDNEGMPKELVDAQTFVDNTSWDYDWTFAPQGEDEIAQVAGGTYRDAAGYVTQVGYGFERRPAVAGPAPLQVGDILWQITPAPAAIIDPLNRTTTSDYCDRHVAAALPVQQTHRCLVTLLQRYTEPDGRVVELTYDGHTTRNVTEVRRRARPGSLQPNGQPWPDIVTRATYSCTNNVVCNLPTSRTDGNGNTTSYTYDTAHGGLLSETGPAVNGVSPQTRHAFVQRHARLADGTAAGPPIWVRAYTSTCRTSTPTGVPAAACTAGALDEIYTSYDYGPDAGPNNLLLRGQVVYAEANGVVTAHRTCYTYDALGRRIGETRPNAGFASCPAAQTAALPFTSNQRYDAMGRVTGTISADPDAVGSGNPHLAVRNSYDDAGRLIRVETGTLAAWQGNGVAPADWSGFTIQRTLETFYDTMGRKSREQLREGGAGAIVNLTQYSYDVMGRLDCTAIRMNPAAFPSYQTNNPLSACLLGPQGSERPDRISRNFYDQAGQRIQLRDGVGTADEAAEATWEYNPNGQIITVIDGNGNRAVLRYDGHARQDRWIFPSATRPPSYNDSNQGTALTTAGAANASDYEEYGYDANGNRTSLRRRDNAAHAYGSILFEYDALGRLIRKTVPERAAPHAYPLAPAQTRDVHFGYDLRGLQLYARFDSATGEGVTNAWDGLGRLSSQTIDLDGTARTLAYRYDSEGNRTRITHPDSGSGPGQMPVFFSTSYDGLGRPEWLTDPNGSALAGFTYAAAGTPSGVGRPGATSGLQFDAADRLTSLSHYLGPAASLDVNWSFTRNPAGQIASAGRDNDSYAWTRHYAIARTYATNGLNQYTAAGPLGGQGASFAYDLNGNLVSDNGRAFVYDVENRLVTAAPGVALRYDPLGRLYELAVNGTVTRRFLYDGDALVAEYDVAGTMTARYVHGAGADVPLVEYLAPGPAPGIGTSTAAAARRNLISDHQGSIVAVSDNGGTRLSINAYDEYGIPAVANTGRFQYTGQIWLPELGMYHYKARIYSPGFGRFLQVDPVGYEDQYNLYAYVGNDPVNGSDPSGLCTVASEAPTETPGHTICRNAGDLNLSSDGAKNIIGFEGYSDTAYQRGGDVPTIGIGHTAGVEMGDRMTRSEITSAFSADVNVAERIVENLVGDLPVSQQEFDALVDTAFNVGAGELSASNSPGLHAAIADGDYEAMGDNLRYTRGPNGQMPGLVERSNSRQEIFRNGDYRIGVNRYNSLISRNR